MSLFRKALASFVGFVLFAGGSAGLIKDVQAADFYVFAGFKTYQMVVVEVAGIQALADENKIAWLWYVDAAGMVPDLDARASSDLRESK